VKTPQIGIATPVATVKTPQYAADSGTPKTTHVGTAAPIAGVKTPQYGESSGTPKTTQHGANSGSPTSPNIGTTKQKQNDSRTCCHPVFLLYQRLFLFDLFSLFCRDCGSKTGVASPEDEASESSGGNSNNGLILPPFSGSGEVVPVVPPCQYPGQVTAFGLVGRGLVTGVVHGIDYEMANEDFPFGVPIAYGSNLDTCTGYIDCLFDATFFIERGTIVTAIEIRASWASFTTQCIPGADIYGDDINIPYGPIPPY
jgi:hypothetical protein